MSEYTVVRACEIKTPRVPEVPQGRLTFVRVHPVSKAPPFRLSVWPPTHGVRGTTWNHGIRPTVVGPGDPDSRECPPGLTRQAPSRVWHRQRQRRGDFVKDDSKRSGRK